MCVPVWRITNMLKSFHSKGISEVWKNYVSKNDIYIIYIRILSKCIKINLKKTEKT